MSFWTCLAPEVLPNQQPHNLLKDNICAWFDGGQWDLISKSKSQLPPPALSIPNQKLPRKLSTAPQKWWLPSLLKWSLVKGHFNFNSWGVYSPYEALSFGNHCFQLPLIGNLPALEVSKDHFVRTPRYARVGSRHWWWLKGVKREVEQVSRWMIVVHWLMFSFSEELPWASPTIRRFQRSNESNSWVGVEIGSCYYTLED